eukprot:362094-Chlamydomonas_euryale.AAC.3
MRCARRDPKSGRGRYVKRGRGTAPTYVSTQVPVGPGAMHHRGQSSSSNQQHQRRDPLRFARAAADRRQSNAASGTRVPAGFSQLAALSSLAATAAADAAADAAAANAADTDATAAAAAVAVGSSRQPPPQARPRRRAAGVTRASAARRTGTPPCRRASAKGLVRAAALSQAGRQLVKDAFQEKDVGYGTPCQMPLHVLTRRAHA